MKPIFALWSKDNRQMTVYTTAWAARNGLRCSPPGWVLEEILGDTSRGILARENEQAMRRLDAMVEEENHQQALEAVFGWHGQG